MSTGSGMPAEMSQLKPGTGGEGRDPIRNFDGISGMRSSMRGMLDGIGVAPRRPPPKHYDAIPNGTIVLFKGLKAKAERNGDRGHIQAYEPSSGRFTVLV
jgi:hypothetical protein